MIKLINAGWLTLEQVVRILAGLFVMTLIARHLGPEGFGAYAFLFSLTGMFIPLALFGLHGIIIRRIAANPEEEPELAGTVFALRLAIGLICVALSVGVVAVWGAPDGVTLPLVLAAAMTLIVVPTETFNAALKARELMARIALPRIGVAVLWAVSAWVLLWQSAPLWAFVVLRAGEAVLLGLVAWIAFTLTSRARLQFSGARVWPLLGEGLPLMLAAFAMLIYLRIDQVMIGQMRDAADLGLYGIAVRVSELASPLAGILQATFYASLVRAHAVAPGNFDGYMQRLYDACALTSWGVMVVIAVAGTLLMVPVFGAAYSASVPMLLLLLLSLPFFYLNIAWSTMLAVRGWLWTVPAVAGTGALLNVALNLVLIPQYGGMGAAVSTVISMFCAGLGASLVVPRLRPAAFGMLRALWPAGAARRLWRLWRARPGAVSAPDAGDAAP